MGIRDFRGHLIREFCGTEAEDIQRAISVMEDRHNAAIESKNHTRAKESQLLVSALQKELTAASVRSGGWIYHSEACIWKDPVTAMQRTKALGLLHKQIKKDSCMSRQGIADYLVTMRKPGVNAHPVEGEFDRWIGDDSFKSEGRLSIDVWQRYASPVWMDINPSDTLQYRSARSENDDKHICPLQIQVIERGIEMWSNPGDIVLSPFAGIGSEGYVSIENDRKFIGIELNETYFGQMVGNLKVAEQKKKEKLLL
jgi:hypothetical protein